MDPASLLADHGDVTFALTAQIQKHIDNERIIWLSTVSPTGQPSPRPVWYRWDGAAFVVYTFPGAAKIRHIRANPKVAVHFNADREGEDVVVMVGRAEIDTDPVPPSAYPGYLDKYGAALPGIGYTVESLDAEFTVVVRVVPERWWSA